MLSSASFPGDDAHERPRTADQDRALRGSGQAPHASRVRIDAGGGWMICLDHRVLRGTRLADFQDYLDKSRELARY